MSTAAQPSGPELLEQIRRAAVGRGMTALDLAKQLSPYPANWLRQLGEATNPKPHTIARIRALLDGDPVPPPPPNNFQGRMVASAGSRSQQVILDALSEAADSRKACPSNAELAEQIGVLRPDAAAEIIKRLEYFGLITVRRFAKSRQVTIVATGRATAHDGKDAPRRRAVGSAADAAGREATQQAERRALARSQGTVTRRAGLGLDRPAAPAMPAIAGDRRPAAWSRDPCPFCAVRGDLGCAHQQPFQLGGAI